MSELVTARVAVSVHSAVRITEGSTTARVGSSAGEVGGRLDGRKSKENRDLDRGKAQNFPACRRSFEGSWSAAEMWDSHKTTVSATLYRSARRL